MAEFSTLIQVILVDLLFAGDNAIAIGVVAASLPKDQRTKVIATGVLLAVILRIAFAVATVQLLKIPGLLIVGGVLLLWVAWKLYTDLRKNHSLQHSDTATQAGEAGHLTYGQALIRILIADVSMSLDNVLAVAGIAREHLTILVFGLALSVVLMLVAATMIANFLNRYPWIAYFGVLVIAIVGVSMIWDGSQDFFEIQLS